MEAAIILPVFIIAMILVLQIIPLIAAVEETVHISCEELRLEAIKSALRENSSALPFVLNRKLKDFKWPMDHSEVSSYKYLYEDHGIDDLISLSIRSDFRKNSPIGIASGLTVESRIAARAYTGSIRKIEAGKEDFFKEQAENPVYIFPRYGEKYHSKDCPFLNPACEKTYLTAYIPNRFKACPECKAGKLKIGDSVYCFFKAGRAFHRKSCSKVDKFYLEIEKEDAEKKGFTPCLTCGG